MGWTCSTYKKMRNVYKISVRKPEREAPMEYLGIDNCSTLKWNCLRTLFTGQLMLTWKSTLDSQERWGIS